jgi:predicted regulator of Ras-like GTPase activity (Roadblock/LC7/MglB family)
VKEALAKVCRLPGVTGALLVSGEGLLIAGNSSLGSSEAEESAAAVVGNLGRSVASTLERLGRGDLKMLLVSGASGRAAAAMSGENLLVALLQSEANLGLIQLELGAAANEAARNVSL